ncbi:MAG: nitrate ABC transporter, permease protein, partial [Solimonas sp.]
MSERARAAILSAILCLIVGASWEFIGRSTMPPATADASGLVASSEQVARLPWPSEIAAFAVKQLSDPFYDRGTNDKGIGVQLAFSLLRVLTGYA